MGLACECASAVPLRIVVPHTAMPVGMVLALGLDRTLLSGAHFFQGLLLLLRRLLGLQLGKLGQRGRHEALLLLRLLLAGGQLKLYDLLRDVYPLLLLRQ